MTNILTKQPRSLPVLTEVLKDGFSFNEENHTYHVPGYKGKIWSVTEVINPRSIPDTQAIRAASEVGKMIHELFESYMTAETPEDAAKVGYANVFAGIKTKIEEIALRRHTGTVHTTQAEQRIIGIYEFNGEEIYVGGSCDLLRLTDDSTEIIELKTTSTESNEHLMQLAAYCMLFAWDETDVFGTLVYLNDRVGHKIKVIHTETLISFHEEFLHRLGALQGTADNKNEFSIVVEGDHRTFSRDDIESMINKYDNLSSAIKAWDKERAAIKNILDEIAAHNQYDAFEHNGARYTVTRSLRKQLDGDLVERLCPDAVSYVPSQMVRITGNAS